jgi:hypothetical protein
MAYSKEKKELIFQHIFKEMTGGRALRNILKQDEGMPDVTTFYVWLDSDNLKAKQYARAAEARADAMFEEIIQIADDSSKDTIINDEGVERMNSEWVQRSRLRVDARKWAASKLAPKKYGDKLETDNTHSGKIEIVRTIKK